jgi:hypothetical protein
VESIEINADMRLDIRHILDRRLHILLSLFRRLLDKASTDIASDRGRSDDDDIP